MTGTILNAAGILIGGILGLIFKRQPALSTQVALKNVLGLLTIFVGLKTTWDHVGGGFGLVLKQMTIVVLALGLGRLTGRLLRLQKGFNWLGNYAKERFSKVDPAHPPRWSEGFITCAVLYCAGPMAIPGAVLDGLSGHWQTLGVKALVDGLATMALVGTFGWGALAAAIPVVAFQGSLALGAKFLAPHLQEPALMMSIHATGGLLVFCMAMIILELKKFEVADYLPSLAFAPLLTWLWK